MGSKKSNQYKEERRKMIIVGYSPSKTQLLRYFLFWLPFLLVAPAASLVFILLFIYKCSVVMFSKFLSSAFPSHNSLIAPIFGLDIMFSTDDFYTHPNGNLAFIWYVNGTISPQLIISRVEKALAENNGSSNSFSSSLNRFGLVKGYEKLTSVYPTFWLGFPFWKRCENKFNIKNHVREINSRPPSFLNGKASINKAVLDDNMISSCIAEPFKQGQPLWEILLFSPKIATPTTAQNSTSMDQLSGSNNLSPCAATTILVFKTHHVLGDGNSMLKFLQKIIDNCETDKPRINKTENIVARNSNTLWDTFSNTIYTWLLVPYAFFSLLQDFVFHGDYWFTHKKNSNNVNFGSVSVSVSQLSRIRRRLCESVRLGGIQSQLKPVPIVVVAIAALSGALQKILKVSKEKDDKNWVNFVVALPHDKEHPGGQDFCNFWTHGIVKVDLGESDPLSRVFQLNDSYWQLKNFKIPEIHSKFAKLYSLFPKPILSLLYGYNMGSAIGVSNMASSKQDMFLGGNKILSQSAYFGLQWKHASMTLALLSYNDQVNISILANESILDKESVDILIHRYIKEELTLLEEYKR